MEEGKLAGLMQLKSGSDKTICRILNKLPITGHGCGPGMYAFPNEYYQMI